MKQKIKHLLVKNLTIDNFLIAFLIINPIFDLKIFYNSISTLIRVFFILFFFAYYFFKNHDKKKYFLLIYPFFIAIYFILHHLNAQNFDSLVPGNFNYSVFKEFLYFVKMLSPYMLIYSLYKSGLTKHQFFKIINCLVLEICLIIIVTNILGISYANYGAGTIKANFFSWFNKNSNYTYMDLLSKGLFEYGNQISAVLLMFLPFTIYQYFKEKHPINLIIIFVELFALTLLGTRVAIIGTFLVLIYFTAIYLFFEKYKFKQFAISSLPVLILSLIFASLIPFNPIFSRLEEHEKVVETVSNLNNVEIFESSVSTVENANIEVVTFEEINKYDFVKNTYKENKLNENFILNRYPYTYDVDFWYDLINSNNPNKSNIRFLEKEMVKRVVLLNNNSLDKYLGITYTRIQNIFNIEKDFVMQYYSLGIIGLIAIFMPYFALLLYYLIIVCKNKLKNIKTINVLSFVTICMIFCISYYSGNLLNSLGFTIYFALLYALLKE